jgi:hypothetical protein
MDCYSHTAPRERKLTHEQVAEIVALYEQGWPTKDLALRYGVVQSAITYRLSKATVLDRDRAPADRDALRQRRAAWRRQQKEH